MRKFIVKNRPKRKYTKKSDLNSSLLFGKTFVGILPPVIMIVALMATIVIGTPNRNPLGDLHLNLDPRSWTVHNPLPMIQQFLLHLQTLVGAMMTAFIRLFSSLVHASQGAAAVGDNIALKLDPRPLLINLSLFVYSMLVAVVVLFQNAFSFLQSFLIQLITGMQFGFSIVANTVGVAFQVLGKETVLLTQEVAYGVGFCFHWLWTALVTTYLFIMHMLMAILVWISAVWHAFTLSLSRTVQTIGKAIAWPFQAVAAYFMQYKPLTDELGKHLANALGDTGVCFTNLGKALTTIGSSK